MGVVIPGGGFSEDRASGAQIVDGSLRFDKTKTQRLTRTPSTAGNRRTWTWSGWVKRSNLSTSVLGHTLFQRGDTYIYFAESANIDNIGVNLRNAATNYWAMSSAVYRDVSGWYHIVVAIDTTLSNASDRVKIWINNNLITAFSISSYTSITQNYEPLINSAAEHGIGGTGGNLDAQLSNVYFIDGQALDPSYFGYTDPLTNTWRPKKFQFSENDTTYPNQIGRTWSDDLVASAGFQSDYPAVAAFDGNYDCGSECGRAASNNANSSLTFTPTGGIVVNDKIEVWTRDATITVNGGSGYSSNSTAAWKDVSSVSPSTPFTLTSLVVTGTPSNAGEIYAIRVDGVILKNNAGWGKNGFHLPFNGSAPIGEDQSGRGNNWTPVNFGGSNTIEKATGALPILNTDGGGKVARVGVRTDATVAAGLGTCVLALPLVGIKSDFSNSVDSRSSNKTVTVSNAVASSSYSNFYGGSFYFDGTGDYLTITNSADFSGNGFLTCEAWVYPTSHGSERTVFFRLQLSGSYPGYILRLDNGYPLLGSSSNDLTSSLICPLNTWSHVVWAFNNTGTQRIFVNGVLAASRTNGPITMDYNDNLYIGAASDGTRTFYGYIQDARIYRGDKYGTSNFIPASTDPDIVPDSPSGVSYSSNVALVPSTDGAVAFDGSGDYLSLADSDDWNFGSGAFTVEGFAYFTGSASQQMIVGQWAGGGSQLGWVVMTSNNSSRFIRFLLSTTGSDAPVDLVSSTAFDLNKWNHFALTRSGNTFYLFIDGILATSTTSSSTIWNSTDLLTVGATSAGTQPFTGFISNLHIVKGTALYTSNFTPPTGPISSVANTKLLCCKSNSSATAADATPGTITANGNAAASNFNPFTANINTQRGKQSGYATLNPLDSYNLTVSNGNLTVSASSAHGLVRGNVGMNTATGGKYYWEYTSTGWSNQPAIGIVGDNAKISDEISANPSRLYRASNQLYVNGTENAGWGPSWTTSDTIGIAFDATNGILNFYINGILVGSPVTGLTGTWLPGVKMYDGTSYLNFGQKPFKFPPPAGFQPLTLANTPRPTIVRPDQYVGISTWTGTGAARSITTGFKPDFVWIKERGDTGGHVLYDTVRGATKHLASHSTNAEATDTDALTSFNNYGFSLGSGYTVVSVNGSTRTYVGWAWKAGGNSNTYNINDVGYATASAAGLTAGTITPTGASVNTKSGFSIITYTGNGVAQASGGASISHGLNSVPKFMIVKSRDTGSTNWSVWHSSLTAAGYSILLNDTGGQSSGATAFNSALPTSSLFYVGQAAGGSLTNALNDRYVAYLWAEIPGFSKFGSYTGNGNADGPVIITGFRPRWLLIKQSSANGENWRLFDTERNKYNPNDNRLIPNSNTTEGVGVANELDIISNGFKMRATDGASNGSGATYIYAAFAEAPTFNLYGAQSNAR